MAASYESIREFGEILRRIIPQLRIQPVQALDLGLVRPRAFITLDISALDGRPARSNSPRRHRHRTADPAGSVRPRLGRSAQCGSGTKHRWLQLAGERIGRVAVEMLYRRIEAPADPIEPVAVTYQLVDTEFPTAAPPP